MSMPTIAVEHACDDKSFKLNLKNPRSTPTQENKIVARIWTSKFKPTHKEQEQELPQTGLIPQEDHMSRFS
jgi:hypothetical protein